MKIDKENHKFKKIDLKKAFHTTLKQLIVQYNWGFKKYR